MRYGKRLVTISGLSFMRMTPDFATRMDYMSIDPLTERLPDDKPARFRIQGNP
jgi:hypothetical protein